MGFMLSGFGEILYLKSEYRSLLWQVTRTFAPFQSNLRIAEGLSVLLAWPCYGDQGGGEWLSLSPLVHFGYRSNRALGPAREWKLSVAGYNNLAAGLSVRKVDLYFLSKKKWRYVLSVGIFTVIQSSPVQGQLKAFKTVSFFELFSLRRALMEASVMVKRKGLIPIIFSRAAVGVNLPAVVIVLRVDILKPSSSLFCSVLDGAVPQDWRCVCYPGFQDWFLDLLHGFWSLTPVSSHDSSQLPGIGRRRCRIAIKVASPRSLTNQNDS